MRGGSIELMQFLLMCACSQSLGSEPSIPSACSAFSSSSASGSSSYALEGEDLLSDSILPSVFLVLCAVLYSAACMPQMDREVWAFQRPGTVWKGVQNYARLLDAPARDLEWRKHYRMGFASLAYLVEELRPYVESPKSDFVREPVDVKKAVAMVIHRLAHGESPKKICDFYNMGASTVIKYTKLITGVLASSKRMYSKYIVVPTEERIRRLSSGFEELTDLPNICGAIGGTNIKLQLKPRNSYRPQDYWSPHGFYSVLLQGVCDSDKVFWDVCCNAPGGLDNDTHLRSSSLWRRMREGEVLQQPQINMTSAKPIRPYIIGSASYTPMPFLVTPFNTQRADTPAENQFDEALAQGHSSIKSAFGILKSRWRILDNLNVDVKYAAQTVLACCVLHNFCQLAGEPEPEEQVDSHPNHEYLVPPGYSDEDELQEQNEGLEVRRTLFMDWLRRQDQAVLERAMQERAARRQRLY